MNNFKKNIKDNRIVISKNGPYLVSDNVPLCIQTIVSNKEGMSWDWEEGKTFETASPYALWKTRQIIEKQVEPSIGIVEDPTLNCSGPLWAQGRISIESEDGHRYETLNRVTLCRCGASDNKPFCNGSHASIKFNDSLLKGQSIEL